MHQLSSLIDAYCLKRGIVQATLNDHCYSILSFKVHCIYENTARPICPQLSIIVHNLDCDGQTVIMFIGCTGTVEKYARDPIRHYMTLSVIQL